MAKGKSDVRDQSSKSREFRRDKDTQAKRRAKLAARRARKRNDRLAARS